MAMAILEGATEIGVYGVDMAVTDHEYFWQRPCMWGWVRFARGRGIKVTIPKESALCKMDYQEGRDWQGGKTVTGSNPAFAKPPFTQAAFNEMADIHIKKIVEYNNQIAGLEQLINTHAGCQQAYERLTKVARAVESGVDNLTLSGTVTIK